jgi:pimeloyl-ACP methyl ester carboxylesterase
LGAGDGEQPVDDGEGLAGEVSGDVVALEDADHWATEDRPAAYRDHLESFLAE